MLELDSPPAVVDWLRSRVRGELQVDSRLTASGDGFIAWPGAVTDGRKHVQDALARGVAACLVERKGVEAFDFSSDAIACVDGLKAAAGPIAAGWYGEPSHRLDLLAVTGTNGKTSTACWLAQALSRLPPAQRRLTGVVGTLGIGLPSAPGNISATEAVLTTPDPVTLQRWFRRLADDGAVACAIEASSIGLAEHRLDGSRIRVAIFTNFSRDHLDYHHSMPAYWKAKARLFDWPGLKAAVINVDDEQGHNLACGLQHSTLDVWTVSCERPARLQARAEEPHGTELRFAVTEGPESHVVSAPLIGAFNISNLVGVIGAMRALGVPLALAAQACERLDQVAGRMQRLGKPGQPLAVVDYAHTPDALEKVLVALRPLARQRGGLLWCVFGCGGDRDRSKRAPMAAAAQQSADKIVVTSDNPRSESADSIISQVIQGFDGSARLTVQPDRARAISETIARAAVADVVCIAGKGHETYQEIAGVKHPFSDSAQATAALDRRQSATTRCPPELRS